MKLCIFGDSVGKGIVLSDASGRYEVTRPDIKALCGRDDILLKNFSMFGCTTTKAITVVGRHEAEISACDKVIIELGGNDCDFDWQAVSDAPDDDHICKTPPEDFSRVYSDLISLIRDKGGQPVIVNMPPIVASRYFNVISRGRSAENILHWLGGVDSIYRWQEMYNLKVVELARQLSVPLIDIRSKFLQDHKYENLMCQDGIHPNRRGYELIFRTVADWFLPSPSPVPAV